MTTYVITCKRTTTFQSTSRTPTSSASLISTGGRRRTSPVGQGDRAAEAELADLFHPRVRLFASVRLHGSDAASDIAQETILAVIEALRAGRLREPFNLPGFVLGTAHNLVNNHHRKQARAPELLEDPPDRPDESDGHWAGLDNERRALVRKALCRLNAIDRKGRVARCVCTLRTHRWYVGRLTMRRWS